MHASKHKYGKSLIFINSLVLALLCKYMLYNLLIHINLTIMLPQLSLRQDISHLFQNKPQTYCLPSFR